MTTTSKPRTSIEFAEAIQTQFNLTFDTIVGDDYVQDPHTGEYSVRGRITFLDAIMSSVTSQLVRQMVQDKTSYTTLRERVSKAIDAEIGDRVKALVSEEMDRSWQPVDEQGVPTGARTTLATKVVEKAKRELEPRPKNSNSWGDKPTVEGYLDQVVPKVIAKELGEELAAVKAMLVAKATNSFAEVLAAEVVKAVTK